MAAKKSRDRKWDVPVVVITSGTVQVRAGTKRQALKAAKDRWSREGRDCVDLPSTDVDLANGDDLAEITESED